MQHKQPKDPAPCEQLGTTRDAFLPTESPLSSTGRALDLYCQDCARTSTPRAAHAVASITPPADGMCTHELLLQPSAHSSTSAEILTKSHTGQTTGVPRTRFLSQYSYCFDYKKNIQLEVNVKLFTTQHFLTAVLEQLWLHFTRDLLLTGKIYPSLSFQKLQPCLQIPIFIAQGRDHTLTKV